MDFLCAECGNVLDERGYELKPCESCMRDSYEEGYEGGYKEGYKDGYDEGYDSGHE